MAAFKKIKLDKLILILEDENKGKIKKKDLDYFLKHDVGELLKVMNTGQPDESQKKLRDVFLLYYSRTHLKGDSNEKSNKN